MNTRTFSIAAVAAGLVAAPTFGAAANSPVALDSCVKAFMADLSAKAPNTLKLRDSHYIDNGGAPASNLTVFTGTREMELTARDAHDNHAVARAVCTVNSQGEVVDLRTGSLGYEPF
jgi:hypothetical protein